MDFSNTNIYIAIIVVTLSIRPVSAGPATEDPSPEPLTRTGIEVMPTQNVA